MVNGKRVKDPSDFFDDLKYIFADISPCRSTIFHGSRWWDFWASNRTSSERPRKTRSLETLIVVGGNPRLSTEEVASDLSLPQTAFFEILTQVLQVRFLLNNWVPCELTRNNKVQQVTCYRALTHIFNQKCYEFLGSNLFIQDETCVHWDSKTWRKVWAFQSGKKPATPRPKLTTRWTTVGVGLTCRLTRLSVSILPPNITADHNVMIQFLKDTGHRLNNPKKKKIKLGVILQMWDNA